LALQQGKLDAYCNDGIQLWGLKYKSPNPDQWEVVGDYISYEPFGMAMRRMTQISAGGQCALMEAMKVESFQNL